MSCMQWPPRAGSDHQRRVIPSSKRVAFEPEMMGRCSWARMGAAMMCVVRCATVCHAQEDYECWHCAEAQQATPCMSNVPCPHEDVSKATCQRLCEETAGCGSVVHVSTGGRCYLKDQEGEDRVGAESCVRRSCRRRLFTSDSNG